MLNQAQIDEFHRNGFLNGGRVLSDEELGELSDALDEILTKGPDGFAPGEAQPVSFRDLAGGAASASIQCGKLSISGRLRPLGSG